MDALVFGLDDAGDSIDSLIEAVPGVKHDVIEALDTLELLSCLGNAGFQLVEGLGPAGGQSMSQFSLVFHGQEDQQSLGK